MKLPSCFYSLYLRRVRILLYALFGVFIFFYTGVLKGESLTARLYHFTEGAFLINPIYFGVGALFLTLLVIYLLQQFLLPKVCSQCPKVTLHRSLGILLVVCFSMGFLTPADEAQTLELKMARLCLQGRYRTALSVGENFFQPTPQLLALRAFALTQLQNDTLHIPLAENFFVYPLPPKANSAMLELDSTAVGVAPYYSSLMCRKTQASTALQHSRRQHLLLIGLLLDRKLEDFSLSLPPNLINDSRPETLSTTYREALVLYRRTHSHPFILYNDATSEANYQDFLDLRQKLRTTHPHSTIAESNLLRSDYGKTYWYFYLYNSIN